MRTPKRIKEILDQERMTISQDITLVDYFISETGAAFVVYTFQYKMPDLGGLIQTRYAVQTRPGAFCGGGIILNEN
jgi:hypothetical protein